MCASNWILHVSCNFAIPCVVIFLCDFHFSPPPLCGGAQVTCSRGVKIKADCKIADCEQRDWDAVVCPGGMPGAVHLKESGTLEAILKKQVN